MFEAPEFHLRLANLADRDALAELIAHSARALSVGFYESQQVEAALEGAFGVDSSLIEDGTYFVAESRDELIGCGGWSRRTTRFGGDRLRGRDEKLLDPKTDAARIRAFFVDPAWARRGVGRSLLAHCEMEAARAGFARLELVATLPGIPFYSAFGYRAGKRVRFEFAGCEIEFHSMEKELPNE